MLQGQLKRLGSATYAICRYVAATPQAAAAAHAWTDGHGSLVVSLLLFVLALSGLHDPPF